MIEGQVAAIINDRELAINRGSDHGVTDGMKFAVQQTEGIEITDPETGESLGEVVNTKIHVRVVEVNPTYSIAQTYERVGGRAGLGVASYASILMGESATVRTLRTDDALFKPLTEAESNVKRGDPVRQVTSDS